MTRVLFVSASPSNAASTPAADDREYRAVLAALQRCGGGREADLTHVPACTRADLMAALISNPPVILHFSGHGSELTLQLDDGRGGPYVLTEFALHELLRACRSIRLVVITACQSSSLTSMLLEIPHVQCVVAMDGAVDRDAAVEFAGVFHQALVSNSVAEAFGYGRAAIASAGLPSRDLPQCSTRIGVDPESLRFPLEAAAARGNHGAAPPAHASQSMTSSPGGTQIITQGSVHGDVAGRHKRVGA